MCFSKDQVNYQRGRLLNVMQAQPLMLSLYDDRTHQLSSMFDTALGPYQRSSKCSYHHALGTFAVSQSQVLCYTAENKGSAVTLFIKGLLWFP